MHQRFTHEDLVSIINATTADGAPGTTTHTVTDQGQWLSQGTAGWAGFGTTTTETTPTIPPQNDVADGGDPEGVIE